MSFNIESLLEELEGSEKTAEETFVSNVTKDEPKAEEKVAEEVTKDEVVDETTEEKVAEEVTEEVTETPETPEKTAAEEPKEEDVEKIAEQRRLVKQAEEMGQIAAHSFYQQLVALGIMPPTNKDMAVPPISAVSQPSDSPVTLAADAEHQIASGGDGYDARAKQYVTKKASVVTEEFLANLHNKIYSEE